MFIARYLLACLELNKVAVAVERKTEERKTVERKIILAPHTDPRRFKGTKVYFHSPKISPDYDFVAAIDHTEDNGNTVYVTWLDMNGKKFGPHRLEEDESINIINVKDAEALNIKPTPVGLIKPANAGFIRETATNTRHDIEHAVLRKTDNPLAKLASFLKKQGISNKLLTDRISIVLGRYYIEYDNGFELCSEKRGVLVRFNETRDSVIRLVKRIQKIENDMDYETVLKRVSE